MICYRLLLAHDAAGRFHHYEVWRAIRGRTAFAAHVADLLPGAGSAAAHALCDIVLGQDLAEEGER